MRFASWSKIGRFAALVALVAASGGGGVLIGSAAHAVPTSPAPCTPGDTTAAVIEGASPNPQEKVFKLRFTANRGVSCMLLGSPKNLQFRDSHGTVLPVESFNTDPETTNTVIVDAAHPAESVLNTPQPEQAGEPAEKLSFTVATGDRDLTFTAAWPADVVGPVAVYPLSVSAC